MRIRILEVKKMMRKYVKQILIITLNEHISQNEVYKHIHILAYCATAHFMNYFLPLLSVKLTVGNYERSSTIYWGSFVVWGGERGRGRRDQGPVPRPAQTAPADCCRPPQGNSSIRKKFKGFHGRGGGRITNFWTCRVFSSFSTFSPIEVMDGSNLLRNFHEQATFFN